MSTDQGTIRIIAFGLVLLALAVVGALAVLVITGNVADATKTAAVATIGGLGTTAVGAAAALLASTRSGAEQPSESVARIVTALNSSADLATPPAPSVTTTPAASNDLLPPPAPEAAPLPPFGDPPR